MSGGVGPTCYEISLPNEQIQGQENSHPNSLKSAPNPANPPKTRFLTLRQLNCLAVMIISAASGMVSPEDFIFVLFTVIYMYLLLKVAFPRKIPPKDSLVFDPTNKILRLYVTIGAIIGLFLPVAYIFEGIIEGDKEGIKAAAPHLFLLASQVFIEGVAFSDRFSIPVRVYVPVFYNTRRIFTLMDWLRSEFSKVDHKYAGSARRLYVGRALAVANMAFWCFNLFGFLLPVYLPKAFKMYYSESKLKDLTDLIRVFFPSLLSSAPIEGTGKAVKGFPSSLPTRLIWTGSCKFDVMREVSNILFLFAYCFLLKKGHE